MGTAEVVGTLQEIMDKIRIILTIVSIIAAVCSMLFGYRFLKFWVSAAGFVIGAILGLIAGVHLGTEIKMLIIVVLAAGFIFACLSYSFLKAGIFLLVGVSGYMVVTNLLGALSGGENTWWLIAVGLAAGLIAGIAAVAFVRPAVIIATSFGGASTLASAVCPMLGMEGFGVVTIVTIVLAILGIIWQSVTTK